MYAFSSSPFSHLSKRVLKDRDFFFFRNACMHADVDILIECLNKDATPTGTAWESPHRSAGDYVVTGFRAGNISVEQFKHTWQWLSDHGYELSYSNENTVDAPEQYRPFSADLLYMIWDATDAGHLRAICDVIHFVVDKGMMFPRVLNISDYPNGEKMPESLIRFMLAPYCPASILKLFLKQLDGQGLTLKSPANSQIYQGETTEIYIFIWDLFRCHFGFIPPWWPDDLADRFGEKARARLTLEDPKGIADNFGDKFKALVEYNSVDEGEARVLKDIWTSLEKMARKRIERGSLDFDQDGLWFWYELNMSITYLATDKTVLKRVNRPEDAAIHVFQLDHKHWYPAEKLCWIRLRIAVDRGPIDRSRFEDRSMGDWWNMPLCDWDFFVPDYEVDSAGYIQHKAWLRYSRVA
ncbi:hypothetical protein FPCIR_2067 [Fusarium pseudocircinatum]|uniref:Uncharacterized protein n=1 Tax=Fusarium pseudocircinatum TaxID=56676 RepID=A0A8H5UYS4_9HYPO|nr:hypothetical protein FPCIR_2067 [Fusarium pseudocircinatum]